MRQYREKGGCGFSMFVLCALFCVLYCGEAYFRISQIESRLTKIDHQKTKRQLWEERVFGPDEQRQDEARRPATGE